MVSAERSFEYGPMFITSGIYDTLEALGAEEIVSPKKNELVKCRLTVYGNSNSFRFIIQPLPFGTLLRIESENPDKSLSVETQKKPFQASFWRTGATWKQYTEKFTLSGFSVGFPLEKKLALPPDLPKGSYRFSLTVLGQKILDSYFDVGNRDLLITAKSDAYKDMFDAGETLPLAITLENVGAEVYSGTIRGYLQEHPSDTQVSVEGVTVQPGERKTVKAAVNIPLTLRSGQYRVEGVFDPVGDSLTSWGWNTAFYIAPPRLAVDFSGLDSPFEAGETISVPLRNEGGSNAGSVWGTTAGMISGNLILESITGETAASQDILLSSLNVGEAHNLSLRLPSTMTTGDYFLKVTAGDLCALAIIHVRGIPPVETGYSEDSGGSGGSGDPGPGEPGEPEVPGSDVTLSIIPRDAHDHPTYSYAYDNDDTDPIFVDIEILNGRDSGTSVEKMNARK